MHNIRIPGNNIAIDFPSEIDEMTNKQYVSYIFYVLQYIAGKITEHQFKVILSKILLDIRKSIKYAFLSNEKKHVCWLNLIRISELMECFIDTYKNEDEPERAFKLKSVRNFIPKILNYYGPENCFENLTYFEYRTARGYFRSYVLDNKEDDLNRLVAVLYRPSKSFWFIRKYLKSCNGERRGSFSSRSNPIFLKRRVSRISHTLFHIRYAVFIYFSACEDYMKTGKPIVDGNELDFSNLYSNQSHTDDRRADVGLVGLLFSLTETGVFGNIDQTDNANLWDVMIRLYQVVMQMQQIEDKNKVK